MASEERDDVERYRRRGEIAVCMCVGERDR